MPRRPANRSDQFILQNKYKLGEQPTNIIVITYNEMHLSISNESVFATMYLQLMSEISRKLKFILRNWVCLQL